MAKSTNVVAHIKKATRRKFSADEKIRITKAHFMKSFHRSRPAHWFSVWNFTIHRNMAVGSISLKMSWVHWRANVFPGEVSPRLRCWNKRQWLGRQHVMADNEESIGNLPWKMPVTNWNRFTLITKIDRTLVLVINNNKISSSQKNHFSHNLSHVQRWPF